MNRSADSSVANVHSIEQARRARRDAQERRELAEVPIGVISNPRSGKNRRDPGRLDAITDVLGRYGVVRRTADPAQLEQVLREFFELGCNYWVCDGGDGTLHWVLSVGHRLAQARGEALPFVVPANGGTIDFVATKAGVRGQALGVVADLVRYIELGQCPRLIPLDTLDVTGVTSDGQTIQRVGFAAAIGGISQRFFDKLYAHARINTWTMTEMMAKATVGSLLSVSLPERWRRRVGPGLQDYASDLFTPTRCTVTVDGRQLDYEAYSSLEVGSIDIVLGGVVRTFRHAAKPGLLHVQAFGGPAIEIVANLPNVVLGTPLWGECYDRPAVHCTVVAAEGERLNPVIDGEQVFDLKEITIRRGPLIQIPAVATHRRWWG